MLRRSKRPSKADREVYAAVTARDEHRCRACGIYAGISAHRHHLRGREFTTTADVCLLCPEDHRLLHVRVGGKRLKIYGNADLRIGYVPDGLTVERRQPNGEWLMTERR